MIRTEYERMVYFRDVVVLGCKPKHRDRGDALLAQLRSQSNSGQSFINGVGRSRKQPHLLPGHYSQSSGPSQQVERSAFAVARAQRGYQRPTAVVGIGDLLRSGGVAPAIVRIVCVEPCDLVEVILKIGKQRRVMGDFRVSKTGRLHHEQRSKSNRCAKRAGGF